MWPRFVGFSPGGISTLLLDLRHTHVPTRTPSRRFTSNTSISWEVEKMILTDGSSNNFRPFSRLPKEVKLRMWELAIQMLDPRVITVTISPALFTGSPHPLGQIPAMLHACRDARHTALNTYQVLIVHRLLHLVYFDPSQDRLLITGDCPQPLYMFTRSCGAYKNITAFTHVRYLDMTCRITGDAYWLVHFKALRVVNIITGIGLHGYTSQWDGWVPYMQEYWNTIRSSERGAHLRDTQLFLQIDDDSVAIAWDFNAWVLCGTFKVLCYSE